MNKPITIYTDGSSIGNPGPGGYGIVMLVEGEDYKKEFSQGFKLTTNNRMELLAVIIALEKIKIKNSNVTIFTDSKYVSDAVEKGWVFDWEKKNFKNKKNKAKKTIKAPNIIDLEKELSDKIGLKTSIQFNENGSSGSLTLYYSDLNQLDDLMKRLKK